METTTGINDEPGSCIDTGDTTWVLVSTVLVLGMMPALALFEAGLLRSKNSLSLISQIFGGLVSMGFLWNVFGFSLVFGDTLGGFIGNWKHFLLIKVGYFDCSKHAPNIPTAAFALFQMMFASITPLLMTGAIAERIKWNAFFIITLAWEVLVYYPVAHWMWGGGWLDQMGALDFAGGIVIHTTAGVGALVLAIMLGRRRDYDKYHGEFPPSNLPMAALGAALLWMGWFGFNGGSALTSGSLATSALASTQIAACTSGCVWLAASWFRTKPSSVALINGVIAGLAGITPASGYISSQSSLVLGIVLGAASYGAAHLAKHKFRIDDALDVSSVHGLTGIIGSISIGLVSEKSLNPAGADGAFFGNPKLLGIQVLAVVVAGAWAAFWTLIIALICKKTVGLRISSEEEVEGLDIVEHQEYAYHDLWLVGHERYPEEGLKVNLAEKDHLLSDDH